MEFDTEINCIANQENPDKIIVYKKSVQENNFSEESNLPDIFYPSRGPVIHAAYGATMRPTRPYQLLLDQTLKSAGDFSPLITELPDNLKKFGINLTNLSLDDFSFNFKKEPSEEYEGKGGAVPKTNDKDQD